MYQNYNPVAVPLPPGVYAKIVEDVEQKGDVIRQIPIIALIKWLPVIHTTGYGNEPEEVGELCFTDAGAYALMGMDGTLYANRDIREYPLYLDNLVEQALHEEPEKEPEEDFFKGFLLEIDDDEEDDDA